MHSPAEGYLGCTRISRLPACPADFGLTPHSGRFIFPTGWGGVEVRVCWYHCSPTAGGVGRWGRKESMCMCARANACAHTRVCTTYTHLWVPISVVCCWPGYPSALCIAPPHGFQHCRLKPFSPAIRGLHCHQMILSKEGTLALTIIHFSFLLCLEHILCNILSYMFLLLFSQSWLVPL